MKIHPMVHEQFEILNRLLVGEPCHIVVSACLRECYADGHSCNPELYDHIEPMFSETDDFTFFYSKNVGMSDDQLKDFVAKYGLIIHGMELHLDGEELQGNFLLKPLLSIISEGYRTLRTIKWARGIPEEQWKPRTYLRDLLNKDCRA